MMESDKDVRQDRPDLHEEPRVDEEFADKMYEESPAPDKEFEKKHDVSITGSKLKDSNDT